MEGKEISSSHQRLDSRRGAALVGLTCIILAVLLVARTNAYAGSGDVPAPSSLAQNTAVPPDTATTVPNTPPAQQTRVVIPKANPPLKIRPNPTIVPPKISIKSGGNGQPNSGTVGGTGSGNPVVVTWWVTATGSVQTSNLSITISGGGCNTSTDISIPTLSSGQGDSGTWNTGCNPTGTYTITLCWSTGNGNLNCNIASSTTTGGTVPTFGPELAIVALLLLGLWVWVNRKQFSLGKLSAEGQ